MNKSNWKWDTSKNDEIREDLKIRQMHLGNSIENIPKTAERTLKILITIYDGWAKKNLQKRKIITKNIKDFFLTDSYVKFFDNHDYPKITVNFSTPKRFLRKSVEEIHPVTQDFYAVYLGYAGIIGYLKEKPISLARCFFLEEFDIDELVEILKKSAKKIIDEKERIFFEEITKDEIIKYLYPKTSHPDTSNGFESKKLDEILLRIKDIKNNPIEAFKPVVLNNIKQLKLKFIDEICLKNNLNSKEELISSFKNIYPLFVQDVGRKLTKFNNIYFSHKENNRRFYKHYCKKFQNHIYYGKPLRKCLPSEKELIFFLKETPQNTSNNIKESIILYLNLENQYFNYFQKINAKKKPKNRLKYSIIGLILIILFLFSYLKTDIFFNIKKNNISWTSKDPKTFKLLILPFKSYSNEKRYDYKEILKDRFEEIVIRDSLNIDIKILDGKKYEVSNFTKADILLKKYNADMILWGYVEDNNKDPLININYSLSENVYKSFNLKSENRIDTSGIGVVKMVNRLRTGYLQEKADDIIFWIVALNHYNRGQYDKCITSLNLINRNRKCRPSTNFIRSLAYFGKHEDSLALNQLSKSISCSYGEYFEDKPLSFEQLTKRYKFAKVKGKKISVSIAWDFYGRVLKNKGDANNAIIAFKKAVEVLPYSITALYNLAVIYNNRNQVDNALFYYNKIIQIDSMHKNARFGLAISLHKKGSFKEAEREYKKLIKIDSTNFKAYNNLAFLYYNQKKYDKALYCCKKVNLIKPEELFNLSNISNILFKQNRVKLAIKYYNEAKNKNSKDSRVLYNLGLIAKKLKGPNEAKIMFYKVLESNIISNDTGIIEDGIFKKAATVKEYKIYAKFQIGKIFEEENKTNEAIKLYHEIIKVASNYPEIWHRIFQIHINSDKNYKALSIALESVEKNSKNYILWQNLGFIYYKMDDKKRSIQAYKKANELNPKNKIILNNLGNAYALSKNYKLAIEYNKQAIKIDTLNNYSKAHYDLGLIYKDLRQYDNSYLEFLKTLRINENDVNSREEIANYFIRKKDTINALIYFKEVVKRSNTRTNAWYNIGVIYSNKNYIKKSLHAYNQALKINPNSTKILYGKSYLLYNTNDFYKSLNIVLDIIELENKHSNAWGLLKSILQKTSTPEKIKNTINNRFNKLASYKIWKKYGNILFSIGEINEANKAFYFSKKIKNSKILIK